MRSKVPALFLAAALAAASGSRAQSSFGPEISAEDFHQHLTNLAAFEPAGHRFSDYPEALRLSYLKYQFTRLGLLTGAAACGPAKHGLQAVLPGRQAGKAPVLYFAQWQKPAETAAVLEIAERFLTQRPRPAHDVVFLFSAQPPARLADCARLRNAAAVIHPAGMETRDASSLVRDLNALQRQGR